MNRKEEMLKLADKLFSRLNLDRHGKTDACLGFRVDTDLYIEIGEAAAALRASAAPEEGWLPIETAPPSIQKFARDCVNDEGRGGYIEFGGSIEDGRPFVLCRENTSFDRFDRWYILPSVEQSALPSDSGKAAPGAWREVESASWKADDFQVLPGEDAAFAINHLQTAINDIDISAYNAAKWRIGKAIAVVRALSPSPSVGTPVQPSADRKARA